MNPRLQMSDGLPVEVIGRTGAFLQPLTFISFLYPIHH